MTAAGPLHSPLGGQRLPYSLLVDAHRRTDRSQAHPQLPHGSSLPLDPLVTERFARKDREVDLDLGHGSNWLQSPPLMWEGVVSLSSAAHIVYCAKPKGFAAGRLQAAVFWTYAGLIEHTPNLAAEGSRVVLDDPNAQARTTNPGLFSMSQLLAAPIFQSPNRPGPKTRKSRILRPHLSRHFATRLSRPARDRA